MSSRRAYRAALRSRVLTPLYDPRMRWAVHEAAVRLRTRPATPLPAAET